MQSRGQMIQWVLTAVVLAVMLTGGMAWAQSADGPYFVVDPSVAITTTHVFNTIEAALVRLNSLGQQAWGATLVLLPGEYLVTNTINIQIPYLKIVTRDGADKARLVGDFAGAMVDIGARGVALQDVKLISSGLGNGISITAPDVVVKGVLVSGFAGNGIEANGCDRLSITGSRITNNTGNGIALTNCPAAVINDCEIRNNTAGGVNIAGSNNAHISACRISNNAGSGITVTDSSSVQITANDEIRANGGPALTMTDCGYSSISGNALIANQSGIIMTGSVGCTVQENTCENSGGPAISLVDGTGNHVTKNHLSGVENPSFTFPMILLGGATTQNTVSENMMTGNTWGIVLNSAGARGNLISGNEISDTSQAGIYVRLSGGNNVIEKNSISDSVEYGLLVQNSAGDRFASNNIARSASDGIHIDDTAAILDGLVTENVITDCGGNGINVISVGGAGFGGLTLSRNTISDGASHGIVVDNTLGSAVTRLSIDSNEVVGNEGKGVDVKGTQSMSLRRNVIHDNENIGLLIGTLAGPASVRQNTIYANQRGGVSYDASDSLILEENSIFSNLGYALSVTGDLTPSTSFAKNWWGSATGPAGVYSGIGNAVLGVADANILAPILPAPPFTGLADDTNMILEAGKAQISFISSFTAGRVTVDRTDTAGIKLVFTDVSVRNNAWVATVPFAPDALNSSLFADLGEVMAASCVLISGIQDGVAAIGFEYGDKPNGSDDGLSLYAYQGGKWKLNDSGEWILENGRWELVPNCHLVNTYSVVGDISVELLTGDVKAIALVREQQE